MKVSQLISALSVYRGEDPEVRVCADYGTEADPGDLYDAEIRLVDDRGPTEDKPVVAIWLPWGTAIDAPEHK